MGDKVAAFIKLWYSVKKSDLLTLRNWSTVFIDKSISNGPFQILLSYKTAA